MSQYNIYGGTGGGGGQGGQHGGSGGAGYGATLHLDAEHISGQFNNIGHDLVQRFYYAAAGAKIIWEEIAGVRASYNSDAQFSRGVCLPGTRESLLGDIKKWIASDRDSPPICWVSGPAGVGKSAVALTIAKECAKDEDLAASFFFLKSDPKRNNPSFLALSLAYGLLTLMPPLDSLIDRRISNNPNILEGSLEDQFQELVVSPVLEGKEKRHIIPWVSRKHPCVIVIDGLDECGDSTVQERLVKTFVSAYQRSRDFPLRLLIFSRPESWIQNTFNLSEVKSLTRSISFNGEYLPDKDMEKYFTHEFTAIRANPRYSQIKFPSTWPAEDDMKKLIMNASGQFSYATTVTHFVQTGNADPMEQLKLILANSSTDPSRESFFGQIDQVYRQIIVSGLPVEPSEAEAERDKLLSIFSAILLLPNHAPTTPEFIELLLELPPGNVSLTLSSMHSVFAVGTKASDPIRVQQNSFASYLTDKSRSHEFYIDSMEQRNNLALRWLKVLSRFCRPPVTSFDSTQATLLSKWAQFCCTVDEPNLRLLEALESINLLHLLNAVISNPGSHSVSFWSAQEARGHWPLIFRSFTIVTTWLKREELGIKPSIAERFSNVIQSFDMQLSMDEKERRHLESWVALNLSDCRWECTYTKQVDDSVSWLLSGLQENTLDLFASQPKPSTDVEMHATCSAIVERLKDDLHTLADQARTSPRYRIGMVAETSEMEGIVSNLLDSKLLQRCGAEGDMSTTFHTISEDVKLLMGKMHIRPSYNPTGRRNNLISWCNSLPRKHEHRKAFIRADILSLAETDQNLSNFIQRFLIFLFFMTLMLILFVDRYFGFNYIPQPDSTCSVRVDSALTRIFLRACDIDTTGKGRLQAFLLRSTCTITRSITHVSCTSYTLLRLLFEFIGKVIEENNKKSQAKT
ncbi:putative nwd2 protein [Mycena indigotica]|uniref:Putative nwd2 protein n=1 Tax=Mycena indigotica TaxID=2126181 RepID=A0A8H6SHM4_9AGAR|nr:putative nwd2 protein [Mycena indigotica]KAF7299123.1 putative nwd2 protein [Mycena indigotica]